MEAPPLSPFPHIKQQPGSPRRISQQHSIYVSPHKNGSGLTPRTALLYKFNGSPSKVRCTQTLLQNNLCTFVKNRISHYQIVIFNLLSLFCIVTTNINCYYGKFPVIKSSAFSWGSSVHYYWHDIGGVHCNSLVCPPAQAWSWEGTHQ